MVLQRLDLSVTRQCNLNGGNQVGRAKRLHDVSHRTGVTRALDKLRLREGGEHNDGARQFLQDLFRCGDAIHLRHLDIHHTQIGFELECQLDSFLTVGSFADDLEPRLGERLNDIETDQPLVFCDEDATRFSLLFTHCHIPQFDRFAQLLYCGSRTREAPIAQLAEAVGSNPACCGFESHSGYRQWSTCS